MADIKSPEARSRNMSAIKGKDTKPEVYIRKLLFSRKYRYRNNVSYIPGHPDIYLAKYKTAVFVHGCFWHRHSGCKYAYTPKSNVAFWKNKFSKNVERDKEVFTSLEKESIRQLVIWECTVNKMRKDEEYSLHILDTMDSFIRGEERYLEI